MVRFRHHGYAGWFGSLAGRISASVLQVEASDLVISDGNFVNLTYNETSDRGEPMILRSAFSKESQARIMCSASVNGSPQRAPSNEEIEDLFVVTIS